MRARALPLWEMQGATTGEDDPQAQSAQSANLTSALAGRCGLEVPMRKGSKRRALVWYGSLAVVQRHLCSTPHC